MNAKRDKFLTEAMGEYWHTVLDSSPGLATCSCGATTFMNHCKNNDFTTWTGFGKLAIFAIRKYADGACCDLFIAARPVDDGFPERYADKLYEALKRKEDTK